MSTHLSVRSPLGSALALAAALTAGSIASAQLPKPPLAIDTARITIAGTWRAIEKDVGTTVTYELTARPAFDVPKFILKRLLKRDSGQMINRLRQEIAARAVETPLVRAK